jgi:hypothetical protein
LTADQCAPDVSDGSEEIGRVNSCQDDRKNDGHETLGKAITHDAVVSSTPEDSPAFNGEEGKTNSIRLP